MLLVAVSVGVVIAALTGAAKPMSGLEFLQPGHWVVNVALGQAVHVDGANKRTDGQVTLPAADRGSQVVQGQTSGYVIGSTDITKFDKSTLTVEDSIGLPVDSERPVPVEVAGGPYLVYPEAGQVVRLGSTPRVVSAGRGLGQPVTTSDGTLWLHRAESGAICAWSRDADGLSCPAGTPAGHAGGLTVSGAKPVFVDVTAGTMSTVGEKGLDEQKPLGLTLPPTAQVAPVEVAGKIAILDPGADRLHLVDASRPAVDPVSVDLPEGDYATPSVAGTSVVLLDRGHHVLRTYGGDGRERKATPVPVENGQPRLSRGEDERVYVDGAEGKHVVVVDGDGSITPVTVDRKGKQGEHPNQPSPTSDPAPPVTQDQPPPATTVQPPARTQPPARQNPPVQLPPTTPKPPPPIPATPPGMPGNLNVNITSGDVAATVTWAAAPANGAPITAYRVEWVRDDGSRPGSVTLGGSTFSHVIGGIWTGKDVAFTVRVIAVNSAGEGPPASQHTAPNSRPTITISRGPDASECDHDNCAFMHVVMQGFEPGAWIDPVMPHANQPYTNPGRGVEMDDEGNAEFNAFYYHGVGNTVWVTAAGVESNRLVWTAG